MHGVLSSLPGRRRTTAVAVTLGAIAIAVIALLTLGDSRAGAAGKSPIVIGDTCDCTGAEASSGAGWAPGLEVWAKWINAKGGIDGHQVKIIEKDTKSDNTTAIAAAKSLLGNKQVVAMVPGSSQGALIAPEINAAKAPIVGGPADDKLWDTNQYVFPAATTPNAIAKSLAVMAVQAKKPKSAEFYCAEVASCQASLTLFKAGLKSAGGSLVFQASISASAPSYAAQCLAAKSAGAQSLWVADANAIVDRVAAGCAQAGYKPQYVTTSFSNDELKVPALDGLRAAFASQPFNSPAAATFRAAVAKYNPGLAKQPYYGEFVFLAWNSGQLLAKAIETAKPKGNVTRADVFRGLYALKNDTLGGTVPPLTFHKGKPAQVNCFYEGIVKSGKLVNQAKAVC